MGEATEAADVFHMAHPAGNGVRCGARGDGLAVIGYLPSDDAWRSVVGQVCPACSESYDFRVSEKVSWADYGRPFFYAELPGMNRGGYWHSAADFRARVVSMLAPRVDTAEQFLVLAPGYVWAVEERAGVISKANAVDIAHMVLEEAFGDLPDNAQEDLSAGAFGGLVETLRAWSDEYAAEVKTYELEHGLSVVLGPAFWGEAIEELGLS